MVTLDYLNFTVIILNFNFEIAEKKSENNGTLIILLYWVFVIFDEITDVLSFFFSDVLS